MFGIGPRLFKSRWAALLWAAGIVWMAYSFAGDAPGEGEADAASNQQAALIAHAL
ncbi:hypothetical protein FHS92_001554 [Sphingobium subterraneum]|uniref:Uncharacterized protein n=1 Tax=Sphingobium subterraneum TaxID=627688 RepID=A0A841J5K3_9SPHN|nr:hypothetical protein [Sphingobium subterraneum]